MTTICKALGVCGLPNDHAGDHVPDHAIWQCVNLDTCALCLSRHGRRPRRYIPVRREGDETMSRIDALKAARNTRSARGCINCPLCHGDAHNPSRRIELGHECSVLYVLEMAFSRTEPSTRTTSSKAHPPKT